MSEQPSETADDGLWVVNGPRRTGERSHECNPPDDQLGASVYIPLYSVWQCPCGIQWVSVVRENRRPKYQWKRVSWFNRRSTRRARRKANADSAPPPRPSEHQ